jgi:hypothetical protein
MLYYILDSLLLKIHWLHWPTINRIFINFINPISQIFGLRFSFFSGYGVMISMYDILQKLRVRIKHPTND